MHLHVSKFVIFCFVWIVKVEYLIPKLEIRIWSGDLLVEAKLLYLNDLIICMLNYLNYSNLSLPLKKISITPAYHIITASPKMALTNKILRIAFSVTSKSHWTTLIVYMKWRQDFFFLVKQIVTHLHTSLHAYLQVNLNLIYYMLWRKRGDQLFKDFILWTLGICWTVTSVLLASGWFLCTLPDFLCNLPDRGFLCGL